MTRTQAVLGILAFCLAVRVGVLQADFRASDPGIRADPTNGPSSAGGPIGGLTGKELELFGAGAEDFVELDTIASGLGPRFNLDSCAGCHSGPAIGGSSPAVNPQVEVATAFGARNIVPYFVTLNGPVREARYKSYPDGTPDGGVHALFVISGRNDGTGDASKCGIKQEDFETQAQKNNVVFRIPTPVFGAGLIESIPDGAILANLAATGNGKAQLGVRGRPNRIRVTGSANTNGNDGTITRFGWKAQNKSLLLFAAEAYNVEQGISNELFPSERDETGSCQFVSTPNDTTNPNGTTAAETLSGPEKFAFFMRFLAPPTPSTTRPGGANSIANGKSLFVDYVDHGIGDPLLYPRTNLVNAVGNDGPLGDLVTCFLDALDQGRTGFVVCELASIRDGQHRDLERDELSALVDSRHSFSSQETLARWAQSPCRARARRARRVSDFAHAQLGDHVPEPERKCFISSAWARRYFCLEPS